LAQEAPDVSVRVLSNIHHAEVQSATLDDRRDVLFVGNFAHPPNVDAIVWFVKGILPLVIEQRPGVRLRVVGGGAPPKVHELASASVEILGWVPDLEPVYARTRVTVAPLRYGAGVKGKIGESLSHGVPVVTTHVGAEGMGLVDDNTARVVDTEAGFAEAIVGLLTNDEQWSRISAAGLACVEERFGAEATRRALIGLLPAENDASRT
jgi:glycosyltransferase involved in cell wall biosynthesis